MANKIANAFKSPFSNTTTFQQGSMGFDNSRENIDPKIKTQAILGKEIRLEGNDNVTPARFTVKGDSNTSCLRLQGKRTGGRCDIDWFSDDGTNIGRIGWHEADADSTANHMHIKINPNTSGGTATTSRWSITTMTATPVVNQTCQLRIDSSLGQEALLINQNTASNGLRIVQNSTSGRSITLQQTNDSASNIYSMQIECDNDGAGLPGGIDMSEFAVGEPLLKVPNDTGAADLAQPAGRIAIEINGAIKYLQLYDPA